MLNTIYKVNIKDNIYRLYYNNSQYQRSYTIKDSITMQKSLSICIREVIMAKTTFIYRFIHHHITPKLSVRIPNIAQRPTIQQIPTSTLSLAHVSSLHFKQIQPFFYRPLSSRNISQIH